ncbi:MAG: nucleotidyl transferase AbiEii/AbiGii toxin family protein [Propionibacteriaceae bacterium]|jgi:predicted nucleotidyltransferase component of viral defense system|nr:nucleotidyl transferase AbiEii/AbiGii toxin family protein [Propionibacteriaceae bacterium]
MPEQLLDFREFAQSLAVRSGQTTMLPVIEKELLHYEILNTMDEAGYLERLTFQGGTCLRMCYRSQRYSEDLDFCSGPTFQATDFGELATLLTDALTSRYGVEVEVTPPELQDFGGPVTVETWKIKVVTAQARRDLPKQRISIQVANVPAHSRSVNALQVRYSGLPTSYSDVLVICETLEEICADKLKAFVTSRFIRYRDLWDLRWISSQPGFDTGQLPALLEQKIADYHAAADFVSGRQRIAQLSQIVEDAAFTTQLARFLPPETAERTILRPVFRAHIAECVATLYGQAGVAVAL